MVSCMAHHFTPIAIMLDRYTNMPYQTWEMKPLANDHTLYTITGATIEVAIEIKVCSRRRRGLAYTVCRILHAARLF